LNSGDIFVLTAEVAGNYNLVAQSIGASTPGFTGSGTIATLTFNVVSVGAAALSLQTELADHPPAGQNANNIDHQDTAISVTAVAQGSTTPTSNPSSSPGSSSTPNSSSSTHPSPTIPEFPSIALVLMLVIATAATIVLSTKLLKNRSSYSIKKKTFYKSC
jgi:hypothetical protein